MHGDFRTARPTTTSSGSSWVGCSSSMNHARVLAMVLMGGLLICASLNLKSPSVVQRF